MQRRTFVKRASIGAVLLGSGQFPAQALSATNTVKLTILHTNDQHSRIEPFPMDGGKYQGKGGFARRATIIEKIRQTEKNVLLFDAGDTFQGTPYFNYFGGELEFKLMSKLGYDAITIGNHDFDGGIEGLHRQLKHATFPILIANYDFSATIMSGKTKPYTVFRKEGLKIGVFGIGIELDGLVAEKLYKKTRYLPPVETANKYATLLKKKEKCDYIICLSHLGYKYETEKISDIVMAQNTRHIDLIIGGHTHTFLDKPDAVKDLNGNEVLINQVGWAGLMLGRIDVFFEKTGRKKIRSTSGNQST